MHGAVVLSFFNDYDENPNRRNDEAYDTEVKEVLARVT